MPWLAPQLRRVLASQPAHALLLHGPRGVGQFELGLGLVQGWLCEAEDAAEAPRTTSAPQERETGTAATSGHRPCGVCAACRLVQAHTHPDLRVVVPEALQEELGWGAADGVDGGAERAAKAKPSREIKVEAMRALVEFAQTTSARGRGKAVLIHPAEQMNAIAANTLLKTLEEPPGGARFVLACSRPEALLPTIRSRCQAVAMALPAAAEAAAWLAQHGVAEPLTLLAATGGRPQEALAWAHDGIDAALWRRVPALVAAGATGPFAGWPLPRLIEALQKLCHDAACMATGAVPRYFPAAALGPAAHPGALLDWQRELMRIARHAEHPWQAALLVDALIERGRAALTPQTVRA